MKCSMEPKSVHASWKTLDRKASRGREFIEPLFNIKATRLLRDKGKFSSMSKWSHFKINAGVVMSHELAYSRSIWPESRTYLANGLASWLAPRLSINRR